MSLNIPCTCITPYKVIRERKSTKPELNHFHIDFHTKFGGFAVWESRIRLYVKLEKNTKKIKRFFTYKKEIPFSYSFESGG